MNYQGLSGRRDSMIVITKRNDFDIKITGKTGTNPTFHAWVRVQRRPDHTWEEMTEKGSTAVDPAFEYQGLAADINDIRPAFRHPATGEVLFFLRKRSVIDGCSGGICVNAPSSIALDFTPIFSPTSPDNWIETPGTAYAYPAGSAYAGCTLEEYYGGYTYNAAIFREKMSSLLETDVSVSVIRNDCTETRIDVTSELSGYMPKFEWYTTSGGPPPFGGGCPQIVRREEWDVTLISAERVIEVCMNDSGSCGFDVTLSQRIEFEIEFKSTKTEYFYGPFGNPIGSDTKIYYYEWDFEYIPGLPGSSDPVTGDKPSIPVSPETVRTFDYVYAPGGSTAFTIPCETSEAPIDDPVPIETLEGLDAYYKSDYGVTTSDGTILTSWSSYAGGRPVPFAATLFTPSLRSGTSAINGYPVIRTELNRWLDESSQPILKGSAAATVIAVWKHNGGSGLSQPAGGAVFANGYVSLGNIKPGTPNTRVVAWEYRPSGTGSPIQLTGPTMVASTIYVAFGRLSMVAGSLRFTLRVNGVDYEGAIPTAGAFPNSNTSAMVGYKPWSTYGYNALYGDIAEFSVIERMLSDYEVENIEESLKTKYLLSF